MYSCGSVGEALQGKKRSDQGDEFLIDKARQASSIYQKANTFSKEVSDLENLLLPTDSNLSTAIGDFFNSLQDIAAYPDDQAPRIVAIEKGKDRFQIVLHFLFHLEVLTL